MTIILGIESSCDETAIAIIHVDDNNFVKILSNVISSQQKEHEDYGGVVPELAARSHLNNIKYVFREALHQSKIEISEIDAISASYGPGLIGGLLVGNLFAKTLSSTLSKPFIAVNHVESHILTPLINNSTINYPFLAVLVSGGHTQIILVHSFEKYEFLGKTLDDSLGETFDKTALLLGMPYPGGPLIEKAALSGNQKEFKFPTPMCKNNDPNFSFSGLKTHVKLVIENQKTLTPKIISDISASFQYTILKILIYKIQNSLTQNRFKVKDIIVSGGVSANNYLKNGLINDFKNYRLHFPSIGLSTDNGVMIAWNGFLKYKSGFLNTLDSKIVSRIW